MNTNPPRDRILSSLHIVFLILATIILAGCSKPTEEAIVGKWEEEGQFIEFFQDSTCLMNNGKQRLSGRWTKVGDDRIKVETTMLGTTSTIVFEDIAISGDKMTFTLNGDKLTLNRKR